MAISADIGAKFKEIIRRIQNASDSNGRENVTLVAASKTKPPEAIITLYNYGQRHFGENYVQELVNKSNNENILKECQEIRWHFIGHLQKNKINKILKCPNLYMIETIDSSNLADQLNNALMNMGDNTKLKVLIQINTSGEKEKSGITPLNAPTLAQHIISKCPHLHFKGLMTIGSFESSACLNYNLQNPNPEFRELVKCRENVAQHLGINQSDIALSMGMSHDFEHAIAMGATYVRVGSSIFGPRN